MQRTARKKNQDWKSTLFTFIIAAIGGTVFAWLHIPLAWMLGPIIFIVIARWIWKMKVVWPSYYRSSGLIVLGYTLGTSFTNDALQHITHQLPLIFSYTLLLLLVSSLIGWVISLVTNVSFRTAIIGSIPGGLSQMATLAEEIPGVDVAHVMLMQTIRIMGIVGIVPLIASMFPATQLTNLHLVTNPSSYSLIHMMLYIICIGIGTWIGRRIHLPTPYLLSPMIVTSIFVLVGFSHPAIPNFLTLLAQLFVGTHLGATLQIDSVKRAKENLIYFIIGTMLLISFAFFASILFMGIVHSSMLSTFLSFAPGGIAEMGTTAIAMHADLATVISFHLFRIFFILLIVTPSMSYIFRRVTKRQQQVKSA
ncbi:AbrB family transcriptional regulator [Ectobacillus sp. sgz5001026]|uniref:AbrB family transcriptional regulator n=1 Tax=Ectobacillus sp. sgz5001026 TaxID=3242473 RepID=UPI0036D32F14